MILRRRLLLQNKILRNKFSSFKKLFKPEGQVYPDSNQLFEVNEKLSSQQFNEGFDILSSFSLKDAYLYFDDLFRVY